MGLINRSKHKKIWDTLQDCIRNNNPAILISPLPAENGSSGENQSPLLILPEAENAVDLQNNHEEAIALAEEAYKERENRIVEIGGEEFFIQVFPRRDQLLIHRCRTHHNSAGTFCNGFGFPDCRD